MLSILTLQYVRGRRSFEKDMGVGFVKSLGDALLGAAEPTEKNEHQQGGAPADTSGGLENLDSSRVPELDDLDDGQALQQQLEALFDEPDALLAGNVQLIGLEKVRKALGGEWERLKATIHIALENLLASQLRPQDRYLRVGEDSFLIIFSEDDELFVSQAVAKIVGKMRDLLLGSALHENGGVDIRSIIGRLTQDEAGHAKFEAIEVEDEPVFSGAEKVGDKLSPAFVQSGEEEAAPKLRQVVERKSVAYETVYAPVWLSLIHI